MNRVLRYICGTKDVRLKYSCSSTLSPIGYSDSDWGGCKINRKSTSGFVFIMAGAAVIWKSKKQGCVAQSSSEAEYMALSSAVRKLFGFARFSKLPCYNLLPRCLFSPIIKELSKWQRNDSSSTRTKHIDIQHHFVRDSLSKNEFSIDYCSTKEMAADLLTKPLERVLAERFKTSLDCDVSNI